MSETEAVKFRKEAEEARQMAAQAVNRVDKDAWSRIADERLRLAQEAEKPTRMRRA